MKRILLLKMPHSLLLLILLLHVTVFPTNAAEFNENRQLVTLMLDPVPNYNHVMPKISVEALSSLTSLSSSFTINYLSAGTDPYGVGDNCTAWPADAKTAFESAVNIWASRISSTVPITIDACWATNLGSGVLGHSMSLSSYRNFSNAPVTNTWYPVTLANALAGSKLNSGKSDIYIAYSNVFSWYFGTDGATPSTQSDFVSVVAHEIAHGLGFSGTLTVSSGQGSWGGNTYPEAYDRFTVDGSGQSLINTSVYPNPSSALATALTSNNVWFTGSKAKSANSGANVKLYAPSSWDSGSSYSHLDYTTYTGTSNALMVYALSRGRAIHDPGNVTMGLLGDLGWSTTSPPSTYVLTAAKSGSGSGTVTSNPTGISCGSTCSSSFTSGTSVTLTASPDSGSTFAGWSGACSGTGTCNVTMSAAKSVTATFTLSPQTTTPSINYYHQSDGIVAGLTTNGSTVTGGAQFYQEANAAWSIVGQGDFDGDGIRDLVWWNSRTGQVYIMLMASPTTVKGGGILTTEPNTYWRIVATGDINGDGKTDLIWWHQVTGQVYAMLVNGTAVAGGGTIFTEPNTAWKIIASADFNGNGKAELLWWNSMTGQVALGQTNGTSASTANLIWTEPDTNWRIAGAGDLDGDGKADIIWHNRTTGQVYGMQTNGSSVTNGALMYTEANTIWEIVSVGNYNSDNKAELLWWNQLTGQVYLMPMNGLSVAPGASLLYTEPDTTWRIQGETEWRDNLYGRGVTTTTK
ncbi:MAG: FG-GAP-like repeat-containing protein [Desulfuromonadales bacterium]